MAGPIGLTSSMSTTGLGMVNNVLKTKLREGRLTVGSWITLGSSWIALRSSLSALGAFLETPGGLLERS